MCYIIPDLRKSVILLKLYTFGHQSEPESHIFKLYIVREPDSVRVTSDRFPSPVVVV